MAGTSQANIEQLATKAVYIAQSKKVYLSVAESLTGGLLAAALVSVAGASEVFWGGAVTYNTELKAKLLGVDRQLLDKYGPVHADVAVQMARGVRDLCRVAAGECELSLSTTGVAGPDADAFSGQRAGTVWLGASWATGSHSADVAVPLSLSGDRQSIREQSVIAALQLLIEKLESM